MSDTRKNYGNIHFTKTVISKEIKRCTLQNPELVINGKDNCINMAAQNLSTDFSDKSAYKSGVFEIDFENGSEEKYSLKIHKTV